MKLSPEMENGIGLDAARRNELDLLVGTSRSPSRRGRNRFEHVAVLDGSDRRRGSIGVSSSTRATIHISAVAAGLASTSLSLTPHKRIRGCGR